VGGCPSLALPRSCRLCAWLRLLHCQATAPAAGLHVQGGRTLVVGIWGPFHWRGWAALRLWAGLAGQRGSGP
jgi:hypothetical protein